MVFETLEYVSVETPTTPDGPSTSILFIYLFI